MKRFVTGLLVFTLAGLAWAQPPQDTLLPPPGPGGPPPGAPGEAPRPPHDRHGPRFIDVDGDGINDLAPDRDGDGLPDALDPMFRGPQARWRMKWFLMMPAEAKRDSAAFVKWWSSLDLRVPADRAWQRWKRAWFFSAPDSVRGKQEAFRNWWIQSKRPGEWERGWMSWNRWIELGGPDMFDPRHRPDFDPRRGSRRDRWDRRRHPM